MAILQYITTKYNKIIVGSAAGVGLIIAAAVGISYLTPAYEVQNEYGETVWKVDFNGAMSSSGNSIFGSGATKTLINEDGTVNIGGALSVTGSTSIDGVLYANAGMIGNASTATALAANGANCPAGQYPLGVDASGAVESCTTAVSTVTGAVIVGYESDVSMVAREAFFRFEAPYAGTFTDFEARVSTAPTGAAMIYDVRQCDSDCSTSCTTIFSTKPEVDASATEDDGNHVFSDTTMGEDQCYLFDIDQIGSTVGGSGASLKLEYTYSPF